MKRIMITGCSGFLSSYLVKDLKMEPDTEIFGITEVDDFSSDEMEVFNIDIRDRKKIFQIIERKKPEIIFHLAAISNVGFSWNNQKLTYEINFIGSSNLLEAVSNYVPDARVVLMSTAELYAKKNVGIINENSPTGFMNPYALSKMAMEMVGDLYQRTKDMNIIKVRSFNFIGPGQDIKFVSSDFAWQIANIEKGKQEKIIKVGNLSAERDFSDVRDITKYMTAIGKKGKSGSIYNLCSGNVYSIKYILDTLLKFSEKNIEVEVEKERIRPVDIPILAGDNSFIKNEFGLIPEYTIEQTLRDILDFWRERT
ncbi:MAG: GDP-mannose 4,6-dehydratase [Acidobacteriota bacterium]